MAKKRKQDDPGGAPNQTGNTSSEGNRADQARPWTAEEMAGAKPLPLPTVDTQFEGRTVAISHAGKGETKPAGRPNGEDESAR